MNWHLETDPVRVASAAAAFIKTLSASDLHARNAPSVEAYMRQYASSVETAPSVAQTTKLARTITMCDALAAHTFPMLLRAPWNVAIFRGRGAENGFPHTHGALILIPDTLLSRPELAETLLHEKVHIFQRLFPRETQALFARYLSLKRVRTRVDPAPDPAPDLARANPDLDGHLYARVDGSTCYQKFDDATPRNLASSRVYCTSSTLTTPEHEHPNETMAYAIARILVKGPDHKNPIHSAVGAWMRDLKSEQAPPPLYNRIQTTYGFFFPSKENSSI